MFGCSHDNGYARLLEEVGDRRNLDRITLVEGVPFERELAALQTKYRSTKFEGLFRTTKINIYQQYAQPMPPSLPTPGLPTPGYQSPYQPTQAYQPPQAFYQAPPVQPTITQSPPPPQPQTRSPPQTRNVSTTNGK